MKNWELKRKLFLFLVVFLLLFSFNFAFAENEIMPVGTLLYKSAANGNIYGKNTDVIFKINKLLPPDFELNSGHTGIYVGQDANGVDMVVEAVAGGVVMDPLEYFVNLRKGEKFLGAKIPKNATDGQRKAAADIAIALSRLNLKYDYSFRYQKGPKSGQWVCVGLTEKAYESADVGKVRDLKIDQRDNYTKVFQLLTYNPSRYSVNITPDGYDNKTVYNRKNGDVFSKTKEFSKIVRKENLGEIIGTNCGKEHQGERYFFFPWTQYVQPTLEDVPLSRDKINKLEGYFSQEIEEKYKGKTPLRKVVSVWTKDNVVSTNERMLERERKAKEYAGKEIIKGIGFVLGKASLVAQKTIIAAANKIKQISHFGGAGMGSSLRGKLNNKASNHIGGQAGSQAGQKVGQGIGQINTGQSKSAEVGSPQSSPEVGSPQSSPEVGSPHFSQENAKKPILSDIQETLDDISERVDIVNQEVVVFVKKSRQNFLAGKNGKQDKIKEAPLITGEKGKADNQISVAMNKEVKAGDSARKAGRKRYTGGATSKPSYPKILISEVQVLPVKERFIELYNSNNRDIDLTGWYIQRKTKTGSSWSSLISSTKFKGKIIKADSYFLIARQNYSFSSVVPDIATDYSLSNDNVIILKNPNREIVDKLGWGSARDYESAPAANPTTGKSLDRKWSVAAGNYFDRDDNSYDFEVQEPTPRTKNISPSETAPALQPILDISPETAEFSIVENDTESKSKTLTIANSGTAPLEWQGVIEYDTSSTGNWLGMEPSSGIISADSSAAASIFTAASVSDLVAGNYSAKITVSADGAGGSPKEIAVSLNVEKREEASPKDATPPEVVFNLEPAQDSVSFTIPWSATDPTGNATPSGLAAFYISYSIVGAASPGLGDALQYQDGQGQEQKWPVGEILEFGGEKSGFAVSGKDGYMYKFQIQAKDKAGNLSDWQEKSTKISLPLPPTLAVVINEVAWMGTKVSASDEWIELYNNTDKDIDISNWQILFYPKKETEAKSIILEDTLSISPTSYFLLERSDDQTVSDIKDDYVFKLSGGLNNDGGILELIDNDGKLVDKVDCSNGWFPYDKADEVNKTKQTMERINPKASGSNPDNWTSNNLVVRKGLSAEDKNGKQWPVNGTPKAENSASMSPTEIADLAAFSDDSVNEITLNLRNSPYIVKTDLTVPEGKTLNIEPGTVMKFIDSWGKYAGINVNGTLEAIGQENNKIVFTSLKDDEYGGDTNNDSNASSPSPGDWDKLYFTESSIDSVLDNVIVRYAGGAFIYSYSTCSLDMAGIKVEGSSITLANSTIEKNKHKGVYLIDSSSTIDNVHFLDNVACLERGYGLEIEGGSPIIENSLFKGSIYGMYIHKSNLADKDASPTIKGNNFKENKKAAVRLLLEVSPSFVGNKATNNKINGIVVLNNRDITRNIFWQADLPYIIKGRVHILQNVVFTLNPGTVVKFYSENGGITVDGTLKALGTEDKKIVFTSLKDDDYGGDTNNDGNNSSPSPGDWGKLYFGPTSKDSELDNVIVRYGGGDYIIGSAAGLEIEESELNLENSIIENNNYIGLYFTSSIIETDSPTIDNVQFSGNKRLLDGHYGGFNLMIKGGGNILVKNSVFKNSVYGIYVYSKKPVLDESSLTFGTGDEANSECNIFRNGKCADSP